MTDIVTMAYFVGSLLFLMGPVLYLTWHSLESETHAPATGS